MSRFNHHKTKVQRFNSPEEYADYVMGADTYYWDHNCYTSYSGKKCAEGIKALVLGDLQYLPQAEKIIEQMGEQDVFSVGRPTEQPSMVGHRCNVPATIMGLPMTMYRYEESDDTSATTPLTIYVECTVSADVSKNELINRGVATLAFALAMSAIRPVEIYAVAYGRTYRGINYIMPVKIASAPLDLPRAVYMLADPTFARRLNFCAGYRLANEAQHTNVGWPWHMTPTDKTFQQRMRDCLDMEAQDVLISGGHLFDYKMRTNPVQWVKDMIKQHNGANQ